MPKYIRNNGIFFFIYHHSSRKHYSSFISIHRYQSLVGSVVRPRPPPARSLPCGWAAGSTALPAPDTRVYYTGTGIEAAWYPLSSAAAPTAELALNPPLPLATERDRSDRLLLAPCAQRLAALRSGCAV